MADLRRWLAIRYVVLAALTAQACISFGHIHPATHMKPRQSGLLARTFLPPAKQQPCQPFHHKDSSCLLCWAVGIGGTTVIAEPAAVAAPQGVPDLSCAFAELAGPLVRAADFEARGPPGMA